MAISNGPQNLDMRSMKAAADRAGGFVRSCRFFVMITPPSALISVYPFDLSYMCEAVEFPGRGFELIETRYYGPHQQFPGNSQYEPASMSFLCRANAPERKFFDDWMEYVNPTSTFNFSYPETYYCTIKIFQIAEDHDGNRRPRTTYAWQLNKAWPTVMTAQQVTWAETDVLRLQMTFAYKYWDRIQ